MGIFFNKTPKSATPREWNKGGVDAHGKRAASIRAQLYHAGFNRNKIDRFETMLSGHMDTDQGSKLQYGINQKELDSTITKMKANPSAHGFTHGELDKAHKIVKDFI